MAENKTNAKKGGTKEGPAKSKLGLIGAILLGVGVLWFAWSSLLRPLTPQEVKAEKERLELERRETEKEKKKQQH